MYTPHSPISFFFTLFIKYKSTLQEKNEALSNGWTELELSIVCHKVKVFKIIAPFSMKFITIPRYENKTYVC